MSACTLGRSTPPPFAVRLTDEDDNEPALILYHLIHPGKQLLDQFPRFGKPL